MLITRGRVKRGLLCTAVATAALVVVGVASAGATVTTAAITSPSSPFLYQYNDNAASPATVTISGTSDGTAGDTVDVRCYYHYDGGYDVSYVSVDSGVSVNSDGTWSTGPISPDVEGYPCQLRAVPSSYTGTSGISAFAPTYSELDFFEQYPITGGSTTSGPFKGYFDTAVGSGATNYYYSVGEDGLYSNPIMPGNQALTQYYTWYDADSLFASDDARTRSEIQIDGKNAYDSYQAAEAFSGADTTPGFPALSSSYAKSSPGNAAINESEPLVSCPGGAWPATSGNCGSGTAGWQSDGVSFSRSISQTDNGELVGVTDTYSSTDGAAHSIDLEYFNEAEEYDDDVVWNVPGTGGYSWYANGDQPSLPAKTNGAIYIKDPYYPDSSGEDGPGALVYTSQPNFIRFGDYYYMELDYQRTVPAGGSVSITQYYATASTQGELNRVANTVLDPLNKPTVSITSPTANSFTTANSVQVSGTASANEGLSLKVNGQAVQVNPDGTWSATVALRTGANPVTAIASDGSGNTAQASETVYSGPTGAFCIVPNVSRKSLAKAKKALTAAHCGVGRISHAKSKRIRKGNVIHAGRSPSAVLAYGAKVGLTVSSGKPHKKHNVRVSFPLARPRNR
jgi:hypothetical protein